MPHPELVQFFSGHFHQDWRLEAVTDQQVIADYKALVSSEQATRLANVIERELLRTARSDAELGDLLYSQLGCHFDPGVNHATVREWLRALVRQLRQTP